MNARRLFSFALLAVVPMCEAAQRADDLPLDPDWCIPQERRSARLLPWLAGGVLAGLAGVVSRWPRSAPAVLAAPPGGAVPPPPVEGEERAAVCVWADARPAQVDVRVQPTGDTLVATARGDWVRLRTLYPPEATATTAPWFAAGDSIEVGGRVYVPFGLPTAKEGLHRIGEYGGVTVLAPETLVPAPTTVYLPVDGCLYQPYRARARLQPRG